MQSKCRELFGSFSNDRPEAGGRVERRPLLRIVLKRAGGLGIGTGIGQGLILAATPLLVRMYDPAEFGALALLITIANIGIASGSARFDLAIPIANDSEVPALARLAIAISLMLAIIAGTVVATSAAGVFGQLPSYQGRAAPLTAAICFLLASTFQLTGAVLLQENAIRMLAISRALQGAIFVVLATFESVGLLWAMAFSYVPGIIFLLPVVLRRNEGPSIVEVARKYRRFALFGLPGTLLDVVGYSLCVWVVLSVYGNTQSGELSQVQRLIGAPLMLASMSLGQIILKQAADLRNDPEELHRLVASILKLMASAAVIGVVALALVGEQVIALILGPDWNISTVLVISLGLAVFVRATVSPISAVLAAFNRLDLALWWQSLYFVSAITLFNLVAHRSRFEGFVAFYAAHELVLYSIYIMIILSFLRKLRCAASSGR